jgi:hypothetical protein
MNSSHGAHIGPCSEPPVLASLISRFANSSAMRSLIDACDGEQHLRLSFVEVAGIGMNYSQALRFGFRGVMHVECSWGRGSYSIFHY